MADRGQGSRDPGGRGAVVSPHAPLGPDQHHGDRSRRATTSPGGASTGSGPAPRASSSTPAASSPTIPAASRCTARRSSWATATCSASLPRRARGRPGRLRPDGLEPRPRGVLPRAPGLVRRGRRRASRTRRASSTSPASTARTTTSTSRPSCARSSSAIIRRASPTTVGAGWAATASATARTAGGSSASAAGKDIPRGKNWNDPAYREWIRWNYDRRLEIWDLNNRTTKAAGGPDCIWAGMNSGSISGQCQSFRDYKEICERAEIIMLDHQARSDASGFQHNGEAGKLIHGLLGWDKLIPESMAMYQTGRPTFRLASKPAPEARMWMLDGIRRRDPALVASRRRLSRRPPHVPHGRAGLSLAQGQRGVPRQPPADRQRRRRVVAAEHRLLRPRRCRTAGGAAVARHARRR